jgi:hypothetical protein
MFDHTSIFAHDTSSLCVKSSHDHGIWVYSDAGYDPADWNGQVNQNRDAVAHDCLDLVNSLPRLLQLLQSRLKLAWCAAEYLGISKPSPCAVEE